MRCVTCPIKLAVCGGEVDPALCKMGGTRLVQQSKWYSSLARDAVRPEPVIPPRSSRELVVAKYNEDVSWLADVPMNAIVYDKQQFARPSRDLPERVRFVGRPNVGREAETYLNHIIERYDELADLTFFVQGAPHEHSQDLLERLRCDYAEPTSLTHQYRRDYPSDAVKALDRVSYHCGKEIRLGVANGYEAVQGVADPVQRDDAGQTHTRTWLDTIWGQVFACPRPEPTLLAYGACWACPRHAITRRSRGCWRALRDLLLKDMICAWSCEILWLYLFSDPVLHPDHWTKTASKVSLEELRRRAATGTRRAGGCGCGSR